MRFIIHNPQQNPSVFIRTIGYYPLPPKQGELNCARSITGRDYPRFHLFIKIIKKSPRNQDFICHLHLDQKKPSYKGTHAHNADYAGFQVHQEAERIKALAKTNTL